MVSRLVLMTKAAQRLQTVARCARLPLNRPVPPALRAAAQAQIALEEFRDEAAHTVRQILFVY